MKIALVYDRVNKWGGAERVLLALHELFPEAPLYTSIYSKKSAQWADVFPRIIPTFLNKVQFIRQHHERLPLLMPIAFETLNFNDYDLVISVTSEAAKGIITSPRTRHICYCLTPTRYLWSGYMDYFDTSIKRIASKPLIGYLRRWDWQAAQRPDVMVAISTEVQQRIRKYYKRDTEVIYPPVELPSYKGTKVNSEMGEYFLIVSRLVKYKKVDLAIKAFNKIGKKLCIVGTGSELEKLKTIAQGNIILKGQVSDKELSELYVNSKALIMPQLEDFGLVAVEAQSYGIPVIAYGSGGAVDTVINNKTGLLFEHQTVESIVEAVKTFENMTFNVDTIKKNAARFDQQRFITEFMNLINKYR